MQTLVTDGVPLAAYLGCRVLSLDYGTASLCLPFRPELLRPGGTISGPAMMTLADVAIWSAVLSMLGPVALAATTDLTFHFLKKPPPGDLLAQARTLQLGRRLAIADCTITTATIRAHSPTRSAPSRCRSETEVRRGRSAPLGWPRSPFLRGNALWLTR